MGTIMDLVEDLGRTFEDRPEVRVPRKVAKWLRDQDRDLKERIREFHFEENFGRVRHR